MNNFWTKYHDKFHEGYSNSSEVIKSYIDTDLINKSVDSIYKNLHLSPELKKDLINLHIYTAIGLISNEEVSQYLVNKGIEDKAVMLILKEIKDSITMAEANILNSTIDVAQQIIEAEAAIESINPLRTMPNDIRSIPQPPENTYTSMQSAILSEGKH